MKQKLTTVFNGWTINQRIGLVVVTCSKLNNASINFMIFFTHIALFVVDL